MLKSRLLIQRYYEISFHSINHFRLFFFTENHDTIFRRQHFDVRSMVVNDKYRSASLRVVGYSTRLFFYLLKSLGFRRLYHVILLWFSSNNTLIIWSILERAVRRRWRCIWMENWNDSDKFDENSMNKLSKPISGGIWNYGVNEWKKNQPFLEWIMSYSIDLFSMCFVLAFLIRTKYEI